MNMARIALVVLVALAGPALAQNSDVAILFNVSRAKWDFGTVGRTEYRIGLQGSYAWQVLERRTGRLYIEVPVSNFAPPIGQGVITNIGEVNEIAVPRSVVFVTPGVRYHFNVRPRLAIYAMAGGGMALRQQRVSATRLRPEAPATSELLYVRSGWKGSPAINVGAGVAFRLTRLLSLRAELRAFRTSSVAGFGTGRNYPSAHVGLGFRF
jgi:opacity protein-like surface antigen